MLTKKKVFFRLLILFPINIALMGLAFGGLLYFIAGLIPGYYARPRIIFPIGFTLMGLLAGLAFGLKFYLSFAGGERARKEFEKNQSK